MKGKIITKPCPSCKGIIGKKFNFSGVGSMETRCVHCKVPVLIEVSQKLTVTVSLISKNESDKI